MDAELASAFETICDLLNREKWSDVADRCDPASVAKFAREVVSRYSPQGQPTLTVDDLLRSRPDMSREVAEYHVRQHAQIADPNVRFLEQFGGLITYDDLVGKSPRDVFAIWLQAESPRMRVLQAQNNGIIPSEIADQILQPTSLALWTYVPLGAVRDGDVIGHVLYRSSAIDRSTAVEALKELDLDGEELQLEADLLGRTPADVLTFRRSIGGEWLCLADEKFFASNFYISGYGVPGAV